MLVKDDYRSIAETKVTEVKFEQLPIAGEKVYHLSSTKLKNFYKIQYSSNE